MKEPIKSQREADQTRKYLIGVSMETLGISEKAAVLRVDAVLKSGVLDRFGAPNEIIFQLVVDVAMRITQIGIEE